MYLSNTSCCTVAGAFWTAVSMNKGSRLQCVRYYWSILFLNLKQANSPTPFSCYLLDEISTAAADNGCRMPSAAAETDCWDRLGSSVTRVASFGCWNPPASLFRCKLTAYGTCSDAAIKCTVILDVNINSKPSNDLALLYSSWSACLSGNRSSGSITSLETNGNVILQCIYTFFEWTIFHQTYRRSLFVHCTHCSSKLAPRVFQSGDLCSRFLFQLFCNIPILLKRRHFFNVDWF